MRQLQGALWHSSFELNLKPKLSPLSTMSLLKHCCSSIAMETCAMIKRSGKRGDQKRDPSAQKPPLQLCGSLWAHMKYKTSSSQNNVTWVMQPVSKLFCRQLHKWCHCGDKELTMMSIAAYILRWQDCLQKYGWLQITDLTKTSSRPLMYAVMCYCASTALQLNDKGISSFLCWAFLRSHKHHHMQTTCNLLYLFQSICNIFWDNVLPKLQLDVFHHHYTRCMKNHDISLCCVI